MKDWDWKKIKENLPLISVVAGLAFFASLWLINQIYNVFSRFVSAMPPIARQAATVVFGLTALLLIIAFTTMGIYKIIKLFRLSVDITGINTEDLYNDVCEACYKAVDDTVCEKIGIDPVDSPEDLRPVRRQYKEIDGVWHFYVEFSKTHTNTADTARLKRLMERNIKKLQTSNNLPTAVSRDYLYNGKPYSPLLILRLNQSADVITVVLAFANKKSCELLIKSRDKTKNGGDLYDDEL